MSCCSATCCHAGLGAVATTASLTTAAKPCYAACNSCCCTSPSRSPNPRPAAPCCAGAAASRCAFASSHGHSKSTCKPTAPPKQPGAPRCKPPARAGGKTRLATGEKSIASDSAKTCLNQIGSTASKPGTCRFQAQDGEPRPVEPAAAIAVPRAEKTLSYR